jgi:MFS family permease
MSEYANWKDRGKLVGMVFGTQALGLIVGPLVALALLGLRVSEATGADIEHLGLERGTGL